MRNNLFARLHAIGSCVTVVLTFPATGCAQPTGASTSRFNYAEALQKTLFFYEAQQSGKLSPNNRVAWRGPSCLDDGKDIGKDLSGGLYDAGDHWTANLTMAWSAVVLATSADFYPAGWSSAQQTDELLETLIYVNDYFSRCLLTPDAKDPEDIEVAVGCGGIGGVEEPKVHAEWAPAETCHFLTSRPTFKVNRQIPSADIPAAMAAAMAASSVVIRDNASALKGKHGYTNFNANAYADMLLKRATIMAEFAHKHLDPGEFSEKALRADGKIVKTDYRSGLIVDKALAAATWLQVANARLKRTREAKRWRNIAQELYEGPYRKEALDDWWRDNSLGFWGKIAALNLARILPDYAPVHHELTYYATRFLEYPATPGGLRLREFHAHQWGSLRHANNAAMIALYYSDMVEKSPMLTGNLWWLKDRTRADLKREFLKEGRHQVDYALGANPYGRSYLVGFGNAPFNHAHHRGAYGAWAGFEHLIEGKPEYRPETARHILYGALIGGPDNRDVFTQKRTESEYIFRDATNPAQEVRRPQKDYIVDRKDVPVQLISNPQFNEVAIDYNACFTANLAFLQAKGLGQGNALPDSAFPSPISRNESTDLFTTDREAFVSGRLIRDGNPCEIELTVWNRSRWPARVTRNLSFRFTLPTALAEAKIELQNNPRAVLTRLKDGVVEIGFPGVPVFPGQRWQREDDFERVTLRIGASPAPLNTATLFAGLSEKETMFPALLIFDAGKPFPETKKSDGKNR